METKQEFRYFTITEYDKEQQYLSRRHKEGWKFTKVTGIGQYHFEQCEPEAVVYQLDYNQEGNVNKPEYTQMFEDCGWEYITTYVGYSYFRKPVSALLLTSMIIYILVTVHFVIKYMGHLRRIKR